MALLQYRRATIPSSIFDCHDHSSTPESHLRLLRVHMITSGGVVNVGILLVVMSARPDVFKAATSLRLLYR